MSPSSVVTADISLLPQDIYDPFLVSMSNVRRWGGALSVSCLLYYTRDAWSRGESLSPTAFQVLLLISLAAFVCVVVFVYPYLRLRSHFHENPKVTKPRRVSFSAEKISLESEDGKGEYKWSAFQNIIETQKVFMFMQTNRSAGAFYVPKRCFRDLGDISNLRGLIRSNFAGKARLRPE